MTRKLSTLVAAFAVMALFATASMAAVTFDPATGRGFVGKGDVQLAFGWNNKALNDNAGHVRFTYSGTTTQETSWVCVNENNGNEQERERVTTTEVSGLVSHVARDNKRQITGFILGGFDGTSTSTTETEGPKLNSCPNANSSYVLDSTAVGDPVVTGGGLSATFGGLTKSL